MREIKFRSWDKEQKVMYEVKKVDFSEQKVFCKQYYLNDWKFSEIELMQYTGLKDATGKEIYEGDIVRYMDSLYYKTIHQIVWNDNFACFSYKPHKFTDNGGDNDVTLSYIGKFEVIGNIYENPELLEKENK